MRLMLTRKAGPDAPHSDTTHDHNKDPRTTLHGPHGFYADQKSRGKKVCFCVSMIFLNIHGYTSSKKNQIPLMHLKLYF